MSPKMRRVDKHLPHNVYYKHGRYWFIERKKDPETNKTIKRKWHNLGKSFHEAMNNWTKLVNRPDHISTMNQLFDRYMLEVAPQKSIASYKVNQIQIRVLRAVFGKMNPEDITPVIVYQFLDQRSQTAPVSANREKSLLSHSFSYAIRWGVVRDNPCRNVKRITEKPRDRYVEDEEYNAVRNIAPPVIQLAMDFAYLSGQRIGDILKITLNDLSEEGIKIEQSKTGKKLLIEWSFTLRNCIEEIKNLRGMVRSINLFCNKKGQRYTSSGFSSLWQKTINKAFKTGAIKEKFTFHDIRAKTKSDAEMGHGISDLLGHANPQITERVYQRGFKKVKPIK